MGISVNMNHSATHYTNAETIFEKMNIWMIKKELLLLPTLLLLLLLAAGRSYCKASESGLDEYDASAIIEAMENGVQAGADSDFSGTGIGIDGEQSVPAQEKQQVQSDDLKLKQKVDEKLAVLTTEEKVAQLFIITPEALTGVQGVTMAGQTTEAAFRDYPVGGIIYMENNIQSIEQISEMLDSMQRISISRIGIPAFLAVDEEGGNVRRLSGRISDIPYISDMYSVGMTGDPLQAYQVGVEVGSYLREIGFNVDFAPVADVLTNSSNTVIGTRSFGADPITAAKMVSMEVTGLKEEGVCSTLKHFPGHGNTSEDSHRDMAVSYKSLEELEECELIPFKEGIEAGAQFVMVGHISLPNVIGDNTPSSLSQVIMKDLLRNKLRFSGIIITDALNMGAIVNNYGSGEAAVKAFLAGADMILAPGDFQTAYYSMLEAVNDGRITQERLMESLERIVAQKIQLQASSLQGYLLTEQESVR